MSRLRADWLDVPPVRAAMSALARTGHPALFVGGCVRNTLIGRPVSDIDIATAARPEAVLAAAAAAGLKALPTGLAHGTVTLLAAGQSFEVTTFRRDVETDGRHARVAFADSVAEDAARRDFTMNALYATPDGEVIDPVGGLDDLAAGRLRFIGAPERRIAEDYLRVLRFFRLHAWYADPVGGFDAQALAACAAAAAAGALARLSPERVGHEMRRLLAAEDPAAAMAAMEDAGVLGRVLPGATSRLLPGLVAAEASIGAAPDWRRRLAALGAADPVAALRLSRAEARAMEALGAATSGGADVAGGAGIAELGYRKGPETALSAGLIRAARDGRAPPADLAAQAERGAAARFPVTAADLMETYQGPELGRALRRLEDRWIAADFAPSREALLQDAAS